ncbi:hypothetical protein J6590_019904 [Homalodisca vitripennis]|nr:hypothetical protein J6590_019904 [Homalodisca vitripennis]
MLVVMCMIATPSCLGLAWCAAGLGQLSYAINTSTAALPLPPVLCACGALYAVLVGSVGSRVIVHSRLNVCWMGLLRLV